MLLLSRMNSSIPRPAVTSPKPTPAQRLRRMHDRLAAAYGPQHWWPAKTPFEVILGAYLTQNTAWKAVERSLDNLRAAGALTVDGLRALPLEDLAAADSALRLLHPQGARAEGLCRHARRGVRRLAGATRRHAHRRPAHPPACPSRRRSGDRRRHPALRPRPSRSRRRRVSAPHRRAPWASHARARPQSQGL